MSRDGKDDEKRKRGERFLEVNTFSAPHCSSMFDLWVEERPSAKLASNTREIYRFHDMYNTGMTTYCTRAISLRGVCACVRESLAWSSFVWWLTVIATAFRARMVVVGVQGMIPIQSITPRMEYDASMMHDLLATTRITNEHNSLRLRSTGDRFYQASSTRRNSGLCTGHHLLQVQLERFCRRGPDGWLAVQLDYCFANSPGGGGFPQPNGVACARRLPHRHSAQDVLLVRKGLVLAAGYKLVAGWVEYAG